MRSSSRICGWTLVLLVGSCVVAMIAVPGCGDGSAPGQDEEVMDPGPQAEAIELWTGAVYEGDNLVSFEQFCGKPQTISGADEAYNYIYYRDINLTFKVKKDTKVIEKISKGRVTK